MKFKKKVATKIKKIREELGLTQQELAKNVGVSRQTIYYLEKNKYNPSLTISFKIMKILNKPFDEIFFQEPIIKGVIENLSLKEVKEIAEKIGIPYEKIVSLSEMDDKDLEKKFNKKVLEEISKALGVKFEELFEE